MSATFYFDRFVLLIILVCSVLLGFESPADGWCIALRRLE